MVSVKIQATDVEVLRGLTQFNFVGSPLNELKIATGFSKPTLSRSLNRLKTKISLRVPISIHHPTSFPLILSLIHVNPRNNQQYLERLGEFKLPKTYRLLGGQELWYLNLGVMTAPEKNRYIKTLNQLKSWNWVSDYYVYPVIDTNSNFAAYLFDLDNQDWRHPQSSQISSNDSFKSPTGFGIPLKQLSMQEQKVLDYFRQDLLSPIAPIAKQLRKSKKEIHNLMIDLKRFYQSHLLINFTSLGLNRFHLFWLPELTQNEYFQVRRLFQLYPFFEATIAVSPNTLSNILFIGRYSASLASYYNGLASSLKTIIKTTLQLFRESMAISLI